MLLFTLASLAAAAPSEAPTGSTAAAVCNQPLTQAAYAGSPGTRKLGELPPGQAMLALNKKVAGCPVAVLLERGADGERRMIPIEPGRVTFTPARERLQPKRRLERD